jgi:lipopolysaccharide export system protein LptC
MFQRSWTRAAVPLALLVALAGAGCRPSKPKGSEAVSPELKLEGVRFRVYRGSELRAFGEAAQVSLRRDSTDLRAADLEAVLPRSAPPVRIAAPAGEGVLAARTFSLSGGVTAARGDDVARTERARYVPGPDGGRVVGDDPIVVEGPSYRLAGRGFTLTPADGAIAIGGGARLVAGAGAGR